MMRRRGGKMPRYAKSYGTPTQNPPKPQGIDSWSGFKVNHEDLKWQWDGNLTVDPDRRSPQDFVRGRKDDMALPNPRPEAPDQFIASALEWENGDFMTVEGGSGQVILSQGLDPTDVL